LKLIITGGAGFIGSNFVHYILDSRSEIEIVVLDKLTYAGRLENLQDIMDKIKFVKGDICDKEIVDGLVKDADGIINFAAESHVDRSITGPELFIKTDIYGSFTLLEAARKYNIKRFVQISTDEVYGSTIEGSFSESNILDPSSPYSASKAGAELLTFAYYKTYGLPVVVTRSSNNYGPYQFPEKLIPVMVIKALNHEKLPIYGTGENVRDWLFVEDNCKAINLIFEKGKFGEAYNIAACEERTNIELVKKILSILDKPESLIDFVADRPGHDFRYSMTIDKIKELGWHPEMNFESGLERTVNWYVDNEWWWKPLI
jgi:dTDP-glucose 4,6-dehydratase